MPFTPQPARVVGLHAPEAPFHVEMIYLQFNYSKRIEYFVAPDRSVRQCPDKTKDTHDPLAPVYDWFTEGFDTADLKEAKGLLDELK